MRSRLRAFSRTRRRVQNTALACRLGSLGLAVGIFSLLALSGHLPNPFVNLALFLLVSLSLLALLVRYLRRRRTFRGELDEAFQMEELAGGINSRLISAVDFVQQPQITPLMQVVLDKADQDLATDFEARVDRSARNRFAKRLAVLSVVFVALAVTPWFGLLRVIENFNESLFNAREYLFPVVYQVQPPPGRHVYALGSSVPVSIRFSARGYKHVTLVQQSGDEVRRYPLSVDASWQAEYALKSDVESEQRLRFEFGRRNSPEVQVIFSDRPVLENMQTELVYPAYTRMLPVNLEGIQERLFALGGTKMTLGFTFSKELASAELKWEDGESLPLETVGRFASTSIIHSRTRKAALQVQDIHGFSLKYPLEIDFQVQQDEKPQVFLPNTLRNEMPLLAEGVKLFGFGVRLKDDFGLNRCVLKWSKSTVANPSDITEKGEIERLISPPRAKALVSFDKAFEHLSVQPGDRISFRLEVYDNCHPVNQMSSSEARSVFVYQEDLEDLKIAQLGFGSGQLLRERIGRIKRAIGVEAPAMGTTKEKVFNQYEAQIDTTTRPPRITGDHAQAVRDYLRLMSTAVQGEGGSAEQATEKPAEPPQEK